MEDVDTGRRLEISGIVQGVGFRPFLFQLAHRYGLSGEVLNNASGVLVVVEGEKSGIEAFVSDITACAPPLAAITDIRSEETAVKGYKRFKITRSRSGATRSTLISPDVSICSDCLAEMTDPADRRYEYPFINCTNCGPRFTIIEDIPYDRPKTSMKHFQMCRDCQREYDNPLDRRFHAQPNACPVCGPHVSLLDSQGHRMVEDGREALSKSAALLKAGYIVAVKGLGGFHLAVDACNSRAVSELRRRKSRPHKPLALMVRSVRAAGEFVHISDTEKQLLESVNRPIMLLEKKAAAENTLADGIAPLNRYLGIMLPYTPLHVLLLQKGPEVLVMTSGNRSGEPLSIDNADALSAFSHIADCFLMHNRDIYFRADDAIVQVKNGKPAFFRKSRGYVPLPLLLKRTYPRILACGGGLKSTVCLTRENQAFLSQYIGDLDNQKVFRFYKESIRHLKRILDITPDIVAHDMHPGYMSTDYANALTHIKKIPVQHHHAHAVSCMAENKISGPVVAVTLDGTGFGSDGCIWGGEILVCSETDFERKAHLSYIPMPGSEKAVLEPWRMAVSWLYRAYGPAFVDMAVPAIAGRETESLTFVQRMIDKDLNCPLTSSSGRLFDAVSSILGIRHAITFESQAAMELEAVSRPDIDMTGYDVAFSDDPGGGPFTINGLPLIKGVAEDTMKGEPRETTAAKFHRTFVDMFVEAADRICRQTALKRVVLSGGVFNNALVFDNMHKALEKRGLTVYTHTKVPAGDGGISLGQAVAAGEMEKIAK